MITLVALKIINGSKSYPYDLALGLTIISTELSRLPLHCNDTDEGNDDDDDDNNNNNNNNNNSKMILLYHDNSLK